MNVDIDYSDFFPETLFSSESADIFMNIGRYHIRLCAYRCISILNPLSDK